jgi:hypothetical protein
MTICAQIVSTAIQLGKTLFLSRKTRTADICLS